MKRLALLLLFFISVLVPFLTYAQDTNSINDLVYQKKTTARVTFKWAVKEGTLFVNLSAPTTGWVAVGFEPTMMMKNADLIIGYVNGSEVVVEDHFGVRPTAHVPDVEIGGTNDVTVLGGSEENGTTTLRFSIPLDSMDTFDRKLEKGETYKVIVAYGKRDDVASYHVKRGSFKIKL